MTDSNSHLPNPDEWQALHGVDPEYHPRQVFGLEDFVSGKNVRLELTEPSDVAIAVPVTGSEADLSFFREKARNPVRFGNVPAIIPTLQKFTDKFVLGLRGAHGVTFDGTGIYRVGGFLSLLREAHPGVRRVGDDTYVDRLLFIRQPTHLGTHIIWFDGNLDNYYHWWVDMLLPLLCMARLFPAAKIALPSRLEDMQPWQRETLLMLGLDAARFTPIQGGLGRFQEVVFLDRFHISLAYSPIFAETCAALRGGRRYEPAERVRIFFKQASRRRIENSAEIEAVMMRRGFVSLRADTLPIGRLADLFRRAEAVVSVHEEVLTNLVFSPPDTKVIEIMPEAQVRTFNWGIANALGHRYGVIRGTATGEGFDADQCVDPVKLGALLDAMEL